MIEQILDKHEVRIIPALLVIFYENKTNLKEKKLCFSSTYQQNAS